MNTEVNELSANLEAKKQVVEDIKAKISAAKSVVLVNYSGLTVAEDTELRNAFRKANVEYKVLKNTLIRRAFNELGVDSFDADLNGTTAVAFGSDEVGASKIVVDNAKKLDNKISAKSAYVNGEYVDKKGVESLASIPSKDALYSMLAGTLSNFIRGLAVALNRVAEKMGE
ncbi:MAG: 50S ribosomal protein L10 [Clostridia bacterium]|nr:50S ribosomal protein L10 [Clostridia bacterium]